MATFFSGSRYEINRQTQGNLSHYIRFTTLALQLVETEAVASIHMISHKKMIFLAIASYGLEAVSSIWSANSSGKFELIKDVITVGM